MKNEPKWVKHDGSAECPVPAGHDVEVRFRNGSIVRDKTPEIWTWRREGDDVDITHYRDWTAHQQHRAEPLARDMTLRDWFAGQALQGLLASARHGLGPGVSDLAEEQAGYMMQQRAKRMENKQ